MSDLAETIAEWREQHAETVSVGAGSLRITTRALADLLDAAEAGARARDAALEEAADIIEDSRGEVEDDDSGRSAAVDEHCRFLIDRIRALRGAA